MAPSAARDSLPTSIAIDDVPDGLDAARPVPGENVLNAARVELGRKLFFDPLLSGDRTVACGTCHDPSHGFASHHALAVGIHGNRGRRNAPSLFNRAYAVTLFWDGRETTLEAQALKPIEDPLEMGNTVAAVLKRLNADPDYVRRFQAAFGAPASSDNLGKALASFERVLLLGDSRVDAFRAGDVLQLTEQEKHGLWLWESKGGCWRCHSGSNFTDEQFHNTGVGWDREPRDPGRFAVTGRESDRGRFKTPTLRGVAWTAPYMHDGSVSTLEEVVRYYDAGGQANPFLDPAMKPLGLTKHEVQSLVAFLCALSEGRGPAGVLKMP